MKKLTVLIEKMDSLIPAFEHINLQVSEAAVGWHLEHNLLVINNITRALEKSDPLEYKGKFSFVKLYVFGLNKIPRGKGKAPKVAQPKEASTVESLQAGIQRAKESLQKLENMPSDRFFQHPMFGDLRRKRAIHFIEIHTEHHLAIIADILKN